MFIACHDFQLQMQSVQRSGSLNQWGSLQWSPAPLQIFGGAETQSKGKEKQINVERRRREGGEGGRKGK